MDRTVSSQKRDTEVLSPGSSEGDRLGNRVYSEEIRLKLCYQEGLDVTCVLIQRGNLDTETETRS
jgi:hypothetical protein